MDPPFGKKWHTREDSGLRLDRQLRWWHDGEPVEHPKIIEAFNRGLEPADDGRFTLTFGRDWCFVEVEDAAYAVVALERCSSGELMIRLSAGAEEPLDPTTLEVDAEGVATCRVKCGRAKARFTRDAQLALGLLIERDGGGTFLRVGEERVPLPPGLLPEG